MSNPDRTSNVHDARVARMWHQHLPAPDGGVSNSHVFRPVRGQDGPAIAMISQRAFLGGPDEASEDDFLGKVSAILVGRYGRFMDTASLVHESSSGALDAALLVTDYLPYACPVIALVVVEKAAQQRGVATALLLHSLAVLHQAGQSQCCALITQGNLASERLFQGCGFVPVLE